MAAGIGQQGRQVESVPVECPYCRNTINSVAGKCYYCQAIIDRQTMDRLVAARYGRQPHQNAPPPPPLYEMQQPHRDIPQKPQEMDASSRGNKPLHGSEPQPQQEEATIAWLTSIGALSDEVEVTEDTFSMLSRVYQRYLFVDGSTKELQDKLKHLQKRKEKTQFAKQGYANLSKSTSPSTEVAKKRVKDVDKIISSLDKEINDIQKSMDDRKHEMQELENRAKLIVLDSLVGIDTVEFDDRPKIVDSGKEKDGEPECGICLGSIIKETDINKCQCGMTFHAHCAKSVGECPKCRAVIKK